MTLPRRDGLEALILARRVGIVSIVIERMEILNLLFLHEQGFFF
jgi:hypothetical protein